MNVGNVLLWSKACVSYSLSVFKSILELLGGAWNPLGRLRGDLSEDDAGNHRL